MTALTILSSGIFFFLVALSFCRGIVYHSKGSKRFAVSGNFLGMVFCAPPLIYLMLHLLVIWQ